MVVFCCSTVFGYREQLATSRIEIVRHDVCPIVATGYFDATKQSEYRANVFVIAKTKAKWLIKIQTTDKKIKHTIETCYNYLVEFLVVDRVKWQMYTTSAASLPFSLFN